jgi:hypothetical protein
MLRAMRYPLWARWVCHWRNRPLKSSGGEHGSLGWRRRGGRRGGSVFLVRTFIVRFNGLGLSPPFVAATHRHHWRITNLFTTFLVFVFFLEAND